MARSTRAALPPGVVPLHVKFAHDPAPALITLRIHAHR